MLTLLLKRGSTTEGVFRRPGNSKCLKELKAQLNEGLDVEMETQSVILLAALFKVSSRGKLTLPSYLRAISPWMRGLLSWC